MAKIQMDLPFSGRLNIVNWMEDNFRHGGYGLKQAAVDYFDQGNNYNNNAAVTEFNKVTKMFVDSMKTAGLVAGKTPSGRYSVTTKMLGKFKYEHLSDKLKAFMFDPDLATVKFDDPNADKAMEKVYFKNKNVEFNNHEYFVNFAKKANLKAMSWLISVYGPKHYNLNGNKLSEVFDNMIKNPAIGEKKTIDFFITNGVLKLTLNYGGDDYPTLLMKTQLSKDGYTSILPLVNFKESRFLSNYFLFDFMHELSENSPDLLKLCELDMDGWVELIEFSKDKISKSEFAEYEKYIQALIAVNQDILQHFLQSTDWDAYEEFLGLIPEVKDIFIF